jgi:hypothetical protein
MVALVLMACDTTTSATTVDTSTSVSGVETIAESTTPGGEVTSPGTLRHCDLIKIVQRRIEGTTLVLEFELAEGYNPDDMRVKVLIDVGGLQQVILIERHLQPGVVYRFELDRHKARDTYCATEYRALIWVEGIRGDTVDQCDGGAHVKWKCKDDPECPTPYPPRPNDKCDWIDYPTCDWECPKECPPAPEKPCPGAEWLAYPECKWTECKHNYCEDINLAAGCYPGNIDTAVHFKNYFNIDPNAPIGLAGAYGGGNTACIRSPLAAQWAVVKGGPQFRLYVDVKVGQEICTYCSDGGETIPPPAISHISWFDCVEE